MYQNIHAALHQSRVDRSESEANWYRWNAAKHVRDGQRQRRQSRRNAALRVLRRPHSRQA
jgi:hypothetical protein